MPDKFTPTSRPGGPLIAKAALARAIDLHRQGSLDEATDQYQQLLSNPEVAADAHHNLAVLLADKGALRETLAHLCMALRGRTTDTQFWTTYVEMLCRAEQHSVARDAVAAARAFGVGAHVLSALSARAGGETDALAIAGASEQARKLTDTGHFEAAHASLEQLLAGNPCDVDNARRYAVCAYHLRDKEDPAPALLQALQLRDDPELMALLGDVYRARGELQAARALFESAIAARPDYVEALNNLGTVHQALNDAVSAQGCFAKVTQLRPDLAAPWHNLGLVYKSNGQLTRARACLERALTLSPDYAQAHSSLGNVRSAVGDFEGAVSCFRNALSYAPDYASAQSNLLLALNYSDAPEHVRFSEAVAYGKLVQNLAQREYTRWQCPDAEHELRIGLVSGDFSNHPVGYFLETALPALSAQGLSLYGYPSAPLEDELTHKLRASCVSWTPVHAMSDADAAETIASQGIHILIDLSGHTAHGRLPVFAYKPAPVQVSWLGYFATTGVAQIDYFIGDPWCLPVAIESSFTETPLRLPDTRLCFSTPPTDIAIEPPPASTRGFVTFGCFNNLGKLSDAALTAWSRILTAVPGSRLVLKALQLDDAAIGEAFRVRLTRFDIDPSRVTLEGSSPRMEYLARYNAIDIALDPFPFSGATTTIEALWMGVPVLTLEGPHLVSRQSVSILTNMQLQGWIAHDVDDYVHRACQRASDIEQLGCLNSDLRTRLQASPLCDAASFAANMATALRCVWQRYRRRSEA